MAYSEMNNKKHTHFLNFWISNTVRNAVLLVHLKQKSPYLGF